MEKIKVDLFSAFGFILPGVTMLFALVIAFDAQIDQISALKNLKLEVDLGKLSAALIAAYLMGYATHNFGYFLYLRVSRKFWRLPKDLDGTLNSSRLNVYLRAKSPANLEFLEKWLALRAMSHNLAFGFLFFSITCAFKAANHPNHWWQWALLSVILLVIVYQLLLRAHFYTQWYLMDRQNAAEMVQREQAEEPFHLQHPWHIRRSEEDEKKPEPKKDSGSKG